MNFIVKEFPQNLRLLEIKQFSLQLFLGLDEEEIVLLDDRGCPSDPVFPGLEKDNQTGALLGKFEAFKFSDTTVVNFEVNVQFCQEKCNPVSNIFTF